MNTTPAMIGPRRRRPLFPMGVLLLAGAVGLSAWLALVTAPTEATMGDVQRIFYFHVPMGLGCFLAFFVSFVGCVGYLVTRHLRWDHLAVSGAEVGLVYCTAVLITGPIWARPVWNTWWTWEPRLTTTLILWFLYAAYFILRQNLEERHQQARLSAAMGIFAFLDVPIVYGSIHWFDRGLHPVIFARGGLAPEMMTVFKVCLATFLLLQGLLLWFRLRLAVVEERVAVLSEGNP